MPSFWQEDGERNRSMNRRNHLHCVIPAGVILGTIILCIISPVVISADSITIRSTASSSVQKIEVVTSSELDMFSVPTLLSTLDMKFEWDYLHGILEIQHRDHSLRLADGVSGVLLDGNFVALAAPVVQRDNDMHASIDIIPHVLTHLWEGDLIWDPNERGIKIISENSIEGETVIRELDRLSIMIDPGHGGIDSGGWLSSGVYEKSVTYKLAERLRMILETRLGASVQLTRTGDEILSIQRRTVLGNASKADLFISLHLASPIDLAGNTFNIYILDTLPARIEPEEIMYFWEETSERNAALSLAYAKSLGTAMAEAAQGSKWSIKKVNLKVLKGLAVPGLVLELSDTSAFYGDLTICQEAGLRRAAEAVFDGIKRSLMAEQTNG
jgi:N-acetylmuramoyl-L-alanine amidase